MEEPQVETMDVPVDEPTNAEPEVQAEEPQALANGEPQAQGEPEFQFDPAFQGAGSSAGLEVWVLENFAPVKQDPKTHGNFYNGDCYIVLKSESVRGSNSLKHCIHFWIGTNSTQDKSGSAAMRTVELGDYLGGYAVQHRELQGYESKTFTSYFKKQIRYLDGGHEGGFRKVTDDWEKRLLHIQGKRNIRVAQVDCHCGSLNKSNVFLLDCGRKVFIWVGPNSSKVERLAGVNVAKSIRDDERGGKAHIIVVESDWDSNADFYRELGSKDKEIKAGPESNEDDLLNERKDIETMIYRISVNSAGDDVDIQEVAQRPLKNSMLESDSCYVLDAGMSGVFVWTGRKAPLELKKGVWNSVLEFLEYRGYPQWVSVTRVIDGGETALFKQYFDEWEDARDQKGLGEDPENKLAKQDYSDYDAREMHKKEKSPITFVPDDGSGKVQMWAIEGTELIEIPEQLQGIFCQGDAYLILYTYEKSGEDNYIIYFWQGNKCTVDQRTKSAFATVELDDSLGGRAMQVRVVMNKEPEHFLKMFGGKMIVLMSGTSKNYKGIRDNDASDDVVMFDVRGKDAGATRAVQVVARAASLCSADIFCIDSPRYAYVWVGKYSNEQEAELAQQMVEVLAPDRRVELVKEGEESLGFWNALGGEEAYAQAPPGEDFLYIPPRLFHCSAASGRFQAEQVVGFDQEDLYEDDVMILDAYYEIYVWIGSGADDYKKRESYKTAINYLATDPTGRTGDNTMIVVVRQGFEPPTFTAHFPGWDPEKWSSGLSFEELVKEVGEENAGISLIETEVEKFSTTHPLEALQQNPPPEGVDPTCKEMYLNDEQFEFCFGMSKEAFNSYPQWKRISAKKEWELF